MVTLPINASFLLKIQLIWYNVTTFNYFLEAEVIFIEYIVFAVGTLTRGRISKAGTSRKREESTEAHVPTPRYE